MTALSLTSLHRAERFTMLSQLQPPRVPRNVHRLKVLGIARTSTENQDPLSLADQEALYRYWLGQHTDLPFDLASCEPRFGPDGEPSAG